MTIFYDFGCPWVYRIGRWLEQVRTDGQYEPKITWRAFPLEQVNAADGPEWGLWERESRVRSKSRSAFEAAFAAKRQGQDVGSRFQWGLLKAKWENDQDHGRRSTHLAVAEAVGLDLDQFQTDLEDPALLSEIGADYAEARGYPRRLRHPDRRLPERRSLLPQDDGHLSRRSGVRLLRRTRCDHPRPAGRIGDQAANAAKLARLVVMQTRGNRGPV